MSNLIWCPTQVSLQFSINRQCHQDISGVVPFKGILLNITQKQSISLDSVTVPLDMFQSIFVFKLHQKIKLN